MNLSVQAHKLRDRRFDNWHSEVAGRWKIEDLRADEGYCNHWISFDSLAWDELGQRLYIGLCSINNDIFWSFDPATKQFESLGFWRIAHKFDAKFHRALEIDDDGRIYAATALLHDVDQQHEAPGGKLLRYDPSADMYKVLALPDPPHYIQSITLDRKRRLIYGFTYPSETLFRYDLETHACRALATVGNGVMLCQPHTAALDRTGRLWATWGESRAFEDELGPVPIRILCYDPDGDRFTWFQHGFPKVSPSDPARVDHMMLASDGLIYVGTVAGGFSRLDPETGAVEALPALPGRSAEAGGSPGGKPFAGGRLAGLVEGPGGLIYGAGNEGLDDRHEGLARIFSFDPRSGGLEDLGPIADERVGAAAVKVHMLVWDGRETLYAGENDNLYRSCYLWECRLQ